jgi:hypothetical protein
LFAPLPAHISAMRFDGASFPGARARSGLGNCQTFAFAVLRHFSRTIPDFRSSNLWEDSDYTCVPDTPEPLDLALFNHEARSFGAHVGVFAGGDEVLHLSRCIGYPVIWTLARFAEIPAYRTIIGFKRTIK